ncbi:MAG: HIRAN domain-containing protein [Pseudomonadota bacterium]|nr:HIRAN domain-containing protein [Pseudomonadota bacterium]
MQRQYRFPIKGSYYYSAERAFKQQLLTVGQTLTLVAEPDNAYDPYAIQIWYQSETPPIQSKLTEPSGYLIGYVPRQLAKLLVPVFQHQPDYQLTLTRAIAKGKLLRLECELAVELSLLQHLQFLLWSFWLRQQHSVQFWLRGSFHRSRHSQ